MMLNEVLGMDVYHLLAAFVMYSVLGWLVESVYMSFCNKKITNRGFAKGPFCPIYGFGALGAFILFSPLKGKPFLIYIIGCVSATIFEYLVGLLMLHVLGEIWWDYNDKPFNYKGIICLESTLAWGFYALGIVYFLHDKLMRVADSLNMKMGVRIICLVFFAVFIDYMIQFSKVFQVDVKEKLVDAKERCLAFVARWY